MRIVDRYSFQIGTKLTFQQMFERCEQFMAENQLGSSGLFWHIKGNGSAKSLSLFPELSSAFSVQYTPAGDIYAVSSFGVNPPFFSYHDQAIRTLIAKVPRGLGGCDWVYAGFCNIGFFPEQQLAHSELYQSPVSPGIPSLSSIQFHYDGVCPSERGIVLTIDVTGSDFLHPLDSSAYGQSLQHIVGKAFHFQRSVLLSKAEQQKYDSLSSSLQAQCESIRAQCTHPSNPLVRMSTGWINRYHAQRESMVQYARLGEPIPDELSKTPVFSLSKALVKELKPLGFQKLGYQASVFSFRKIDAYHHAVSLIIDISPRRKTISAAIDLSGLGFSHRFSLPEYQPVDQTDAENWCQELAAFLGGEFDTSLGALSVQYPPSPAWLYTDHDTH